MSELNQQPTQQKLATEPEFEPDADNVSRPVEPEKPPVTLQSKSADTLWSKTLEPDLNATDTSTPVLQSKTPETAQSKTPKTGYRSGNKLGWRPVKFTRKKGNPTVTSDGYFWAPDGNHWSLRDQKTGKHIMYANAKTVKALETIYGKPKAKPKTLRKKTTEQNSSG